MIKDGNMRFVKIILTLLLIGVTLITARQFAIRNTDKTKQAQDKHKLDVVFAIPRDVYGGYDLGKVSLLENGEAWAAGYDGQDINRLYHSKDGGKTWEIVTVPSNGCCTFKALHFSDSEHGWVVGGRGLIIRTIDGGKSWEKLKAPTETDLSAVNFVNSQVGFVAGRNALLDPITDVVTGSFEVLCTKDGGETWKSCYKENEPSTVFQIITLSESVAIIALDGTRLIKTEDQGVTWRELSIPMKSVFSIAVSPDGAIWAVGRQGTFQRSDDAGQTWKPAPLLENSTIKNWDAIAFNKKGNGFAVGANNALAFTPDCGRTWEIHNLKVSDDLRAVRVQDSFAIVLGAKNAYRINF
jgi:photosystem II stability/assembly factor-like uncharacterized protein